MDRSRKLRKRGLKNLLPAKWVIKKINKAKLRKKAAP